MRFFRNICSASVTVIVVASPWYFMNIDSVLGQLKSERPIIGFGNQIASFDFFSYLNYLIRYQTGFLLFVVFAVSVCFLIFKKKLNYFLITWLT